MLIMELDQKPSLRYPKGPKLYKNKKTLLIYNPKTPMPDTIMYQYAKFERNL